MSTPIPQNSVRFRLSELASIVGASAPALEDEILDDEIVGIRIDSRVISGGDCFIALRGERFDGHDYLEDVAARGAKALIVEESFAGEIPADIAVFRVADTLYALGELARAHRRRARDLRVIGITGSAGKTGAKELLAALTREAGIEALITAGNLNNRIGLPMTLLSLEKESLAILEMGTSEPGEIARLAEITRPEIGIITLIDASHTEGLGGIEGVAREKAALFEALDESGWAIGSIDEPALAEIMDHVRAKPLRYGRREGADLRITGHRFSPSGTTVSFESRGEAFQLETPLLGEPAVNQLAIALLVAEVLELEREILSRAAASIMPRSGRLAIQESEGVLIIDDAYNANPRSMRAALELCRELARERGGRAIALLGDMRELGALEKESHRDVLSFADVEFYLVGDAFSEAARGTSASVFSEPVAAASALRPLLHPHDVVVIKGSRSMGMERAIPILLAPKKEGVER